MYLYVPEEERKGPNKNTKRKKHKSIMAHPRKTPIDRCRLAVEPIPQRG
jgi:hypothetical protein